MFVPCVASRILPITSSLSAGAGSGRGTAPPSVRHYCTGGRGPSPAALLCFFFCGGGSFKDAGGRALHYRGTLVPVTPSFHHQQLPVNPAYINFLPAWQRRQGCAALPALQSRYPPTTTTPHPQQLHPYCNLLMSLRVCMNKRCKLWRLLAVTVGLQRAD